MGVRLRVVLDQVADIVDADQATASDDLVAGLIATAPSGCEVEAIVPARAVPAHEGLAGVRTLSLPRRELAAAWQLGVVPGVGGGLIHAPTIMAPLVRHDRVHDNDQTTATLWDLRAWEAPDTLTKSVVAWHKGMLRRATKHADAVVVPSHAFAERLGEIAKLGERIRVIPGAAPSGFTVPLDADQRRSALSVPRGFVVLTGTEATLAAGFRAAAAAGVDTVVLDAAEGAEPRIAEVAAAAGLAESRAHVRGALSAPDRAAVLAAASALVATDPGTAWPWRAIEAMTLGVPVVAVDSGVHRDVIADGGAIADEADIVDALLAAVGPASRRLSVLGSDRARAFSWLSSAERVWSLHADL
ncbi:glycosyltransferase [Microbacterium sp.]|uniref:glycosyltransferase n=1 Tax=Microbacterium sp. TaxID=51671 RepID=UPI0039E4FD55